MIRELSDLHAASKPQARCEGKRAADASGLLVEHPFNGSNGIGRGDFFEAPEINGTFAKETRRTIGGGPQQLMGRIWIIGKARPGEVRARTAEGHDHRRAGSGGDVHGTGVIGEHGIAGGKGRNQFR